MAKSPLRAKDEAGVEHTMDHFFIHGLGHYLGMDVHDVGDTGKPCGPGEVFTIEPGIYIPSEGFGVRIEDDYLVTKDGLEKLSKDIPCRGRRDRAAHGRGAEGSAQGDGPARLRYVGAPTRLAVEPARGRDARGTIAQHRSVLSIRATCWIDVERTGRESTSELADDPSLRESLLRVSIDPSGRSRQLAPDLLHMAVDPTLEPSLRPGREPAGPSSSGSAAGTPALLRRLEEMLGRLRSPGRHRGAAPRGGPGRGHGTPSATGRHRTRRRDRPDRRGRTDTPRDRTATFRRAPAGPVARDRGPLQAPRGDRRGGDGDASTGPSRSSRSGGRWRSS